MMALQLGALRDALLSAGTPPDKADKAAEEVASHEGFRMTAVNRMTRFGFAAGFAAGGVVGALLVRLFGGQ
jgi:hypothetical protein